MSMLMMYKFNKFMHVSPCIRILSNNVGFIKIIIQVKIMMFMLILKFCIMLGKNNPLLRIASLCLLFSIWLIGPNKLLLGIQGLIILMNKIVK